MASSRNNIPPFWDVIPQFFVIPLKGAGIITLLICTALVTYIPLKLVFIATGFAIVKYAMEILRNTAEGRLQAPSLNAEVLNENYELPFKQLLLFLLPLFILSKIDGNFTTFIIVSNIILLYILILPASVMTLAYTNSFFSAINPFFVMSLIGRIGWSYGILYIFLLLLNGGSSTAYYFLVGDSVNASVFLAVLFQIYFAWVMYAMMGYVLYQYHEDIGYDLPEDSFDSNEQSTVLASFHDLVENEDYTGAQHELKERILRDPDNLDLRIKFHKIVKISGDNAQLTVHGVGLIGRLLMVRQVVDAVNVYLDCIKVDADFAPESDTHYLPLVEEMRRMRLYKEAVRLSSGFHQTFTTSADTPKLYLLIAKIFIEDLSQDDKAKPILAFLAKKYIGHEVEAEVKRYNAFLTRV